MNNEVIPAKQTTYGSKCEMANCRSYLDPNIKKSYFRFPHNDYYCSQWAFACARPDLVELYLKKGSIYLYKTRKVCEDHFITKDFRNPALLRQGLFKGVVPTKNLPELKTVINIIINKSTKQSKVDINEDSIEPLPVVVPPKIKKSLRIQQKNFTFVNKLQPIVLNNVKIKTSNPIKFQSCKQGRQNKSKIK